MDEENEYENTGAAMEAEIDEMYGGPLEDEESDEA